MSLVPYEIYAIKYGERIGTRGGMFVYGDPHDVPMAMDYFVWAARNPERTIVIDVGYAREEGEKRGRTFLRCPTEGLRLIGIEASEVKDVIITHMHYDHVGNLDAFPERTFSRPGRGARVCHGTGDDAQGAAFIVCTQ